MCSFVTAGSLAAETWRSLRIDPPRISLAGPGDSQHFLITATRADGLEIDVTARARVESVAPGVVQVDQSQGVFIGQAKGEARIIARLDGAEAETVVRVGDQRADLAVSFSRDILSILTTKGCNSSACHGSPAGQAGFRLSLFGGDIAADHRMIVSEHEGRRVDLANHENSLLLKKPSYTVPHGGGNLMNADSDEYRMLLDWLKRGAPLDSGGVQLTALELYPRERILEGAGVRQPLVVIGRLSDGTTHDMTREVRFSVEDAGVVSEPAAGAVTSKGHGLTTVLARAMGKASTAQMIVIDASAGADYPRIEAHNFIDTHIYAKLCQVNIRPYSMTGDRAFLRRVYLDAIGRLPTPDETVRFLADASPQKRARLIDELLDHPDYARHWMVKFEDWFRNHQFNSQGRTNGSYKRWIRKMVEEDRPYDQAVREMLTATGDTTVLPAGNFWHPAIDFMIRTFDLTKATPTVSRLFLGVRIECAECHNHPLENLTQDDFYGLAAFFARMKVKHGYGQYRRIWYTEREGEVTHPVTKQPVAPKFLGGETPEIPPNTDRREVLADWITADPQFARATVNRIWAEYFGRGLVEPYDDFRSTNPPTHPELLDQLARYFADSGYRFKALHRLILNSRAYQTASREPGRQGESGPLEQALFARYEPRKLSAEVLLDSIGQVTGVPHPFRNYPEGTSSKDLIATNGPDYFLTAFGFPRRDIMAPREESPSLSQALHLMNSETIRDKVEAPNNVLGGLLERGASDDEIIGELWNRALTRPPTDNERAALQAYVQSEREAGRDRRRILENVLWTVLNAKEFQLNQ